MNLHTTYELGEIVTPFIYVPIFKYYSIGNLELSVGHLLMIYIIIQPFLFLIPLLAIGGCLYALFEFLVDKKGKPGGII